MLLPSPSAPFVHSKLCRRKVIPALLSSLLSHAGSQSVDHLVKNDYSESFRGCMEKLTSNGDPEIVNSRMFSNLESERTKD